MRNSRQFANLPLVNQIPRSTPFDPGELHALPPKSFIYHDGQYREVIGFDEEKRFVIFVAGTPSALVLPN